MRKLVSIGVALALLTMAVVPAAVAAADYEEPDTYAKVPFAIIASGIDMVGQLVEAIPMIADALPAGLDIGAITGIIGPWTAGPLSWTVDMLAWGLDGGAKVWDLVDSAFGIGYPVIGELLDTVACGLMTCWSDTPCTGEFTPCG